MLDYLAAIYTKVCIEVYATICIHAYLCVSFHVSIETCILNLNIHVLKLAVASVYHHYWLLFAQS